jgi:hypothetical protein
VLSTFLVFVVIPVGALVVIGGLAYAGGDRGRVNRRYRPGRRYDFQPIWFLAAPERVGPAMNGSADTHALDRGEQPAIGSSVIEDSSGARVLPGPTGGASDRW